MTPADVDQYKRDGFVVLRNVVDSAVFSPLEGDLLAALKEHDVSVDSMFDPWMVPFLWANNEPNGFGQRLYEKMRESVGLVHIANHLASFASALLVDKNMAVRAPRFRLDLPHDTRFVAHWHQDHAYVGGSIHTVTAWVPLQDTDWPMGPLLVAPRSHHRGLLLHEEHQVPGRQTPIIDLPWDTLPLQLVSMKRGDVLFFHSLLLHSGQVNFSDRVRYSVQVRYEPL